MKLAIVTGCPNGLVTIWIAHTTFCSAYVAVVLSSRLRELGVEYLSARA